MAVLFWPVVYRVVILDGIHGVIIGDRRQYISVLRSYARQRCKIKMFLFHIKVNTKRYNVVV